MPRGRHRHSPPLHRVLQPLAVAGVSLLCAAGAWLFADPLVLRGLVAAAAAAAVAGAVLMRNWDRIAGRRVADLIRARASDEWKAEEQLAELESDLDESRGLGVKLEAKLRSKRIELAALRGEHAALLRRYATAETERASALEGRRLLAIEAAVSPRAALPAAGSTLTPEAYAKAAQALDGLCRSAALQGPPRERQLQQEQEQAQGPQEAAEPGKAGAVDDERSLPSSALLRAPCDISATAVPYTARQATTRRPVGRFDFFGLQKAAAVPQPAQPAAVQHEDHADVVGAETIEVRRAEAGPDAVAREAGEVIDLTAHDETERIDVAGLRSAIS